MNSLPRRSSLFVSAAALALGVAAALALPPAHADSDHDRARAAVQAGQVLPLGTVLEHLAREHPGQVLKVELEQEQGRWIYEVRQVQPGGRLVKLRLDAATGALLDSRDKTRGRDRTDR
jgi:uncharacterized membrane protein YkoI